MALVIEDGSIVTGADSFVSRADMITYAANRGVTLVDDETTDVLLRKAADYINSLGPKLKGYLTDRDQPMAFPRSGVTIENWTWSNIEIPRAVLNAQYTLVMAINAGEDPYNPTTADMPVIEERVEGAIDVKYANPGQALKVNKDSNWQTHINMLLKYNGMSPVIRS